jgi:hypothetical protein
MNAITHRADKLTPDPQLGKVQMTLVFRERRHLGGISSRWET